MSFLSSILGNVAQKALFLINSVGYLGILMLMVAESMFIPIPSELVMPFAGYLASIGQFNMLYVYLFSLLGSIIGSLISYYIGYIGGHNFLMRYGSYFLLEKEDLVKTENWFKKKGEITILLGRFIPVVRHLISIPAGIGKMNIRKFLLYTAIGASGWNMFLAYLGYFMGKNWALVRHYSEPFSLLMAIVIVCGVAYVGWHLIGRKLRKMSIKSKRK